jgi:hypothetical protein
MSKQEIRPPEVGGRISSTFLRLPRLFPNAYSGRPLAEIPRCAQNDANSRCHPERSEGSHSNWPSVVTTRSYCPKVKIACISSRVSRLLMSGRPGK